MKNLTSITVILDRSGSMASVKDETISGFNHFIEAQKKVEGEAELSLIQFDHEHEVVYLGKNLKDVPNLDNTTFSPRGMTALLDAIGKTIVDVGITLASKDESDRPNNVLFVIITDGHENSSREYQKSQINEMINHQKDNYKWEFVFIGANQDAIAEAGKLGIKADNSLNYASNAAGTEGLFKSLSNNVRSYRAGGQVAFSLQDREIQKKAGAKKD